MTKKNTNKFVIFNKTRCLEKYIPTNRELKENIKRKIVSKRKEKKKIINLPTRKKTRCACGLVFVEKKAI